MLASPTPYPYVGSYALLETERLELVRVIARRAAFALIAFPLRDGASGNMEVPESDLIDATPLTAEEQREFHDLDRHLAGRSLRTPKQKREAARRDVLRLRIIHGPILLRLLRQMRAQAAMRRAA
jgi:hypothetical protein